MTLTSGSRLGSYEILAPIGAGGMGEVYRARDTKLNREVAVKILPSEVAQDSDRLARFKREAQLLASLNHPHIASIYGLEELEERPFLVLELVEGEDLSEQLKKGPVLMDEALSIARQIAEALEEAHEKGIVHRDLKPGNIKLTPEGKVKVLDFGLAKAYEVDPSGSSSAGLSQSPTLTRQETAAGVILGTAAYMSPEQARGKPVDKRADIWAFGVVLYEMLTGRELFSGETVSDTLASILKNDVDLNVLPPSTPSRVRDLLGRCLRKDPLQRLRDIGDGRIAIEGAINQPRVEVKVSNRPRWLQVATIGLALFVGTLAGVGIRYALEPSPSTNPPDWRFTLDVGPDVYLGGPNNRLVALSPDGSLLAYAVHGGQSSQEVHLRWMNELEAHPIPGTNRAQGPFFSPDGKWIAYFTFPGDTLFKVSVQGGKPVRLCDARVFWGGSWGVDDTIYFSTLGAIQRISAAGGEPEVVLQPDEAGKDVGYFYPNVLPGSKALLFTAGTDEEDFTEARIELLDLVTLETRTLIDRGSDARYVPTGHIVFVLEGELMAVPFDLDRREVRGSPVTVLDAISYRKGFGAGEWDYSEEGVLTYVPPGPELPTFRMVWKHRDGSVETLAMPAATVHSARLSPKGRLVALLVEEDSYPRLLLYDLRREILAPVTRDKPGFDFHPIWTPDGKRLTFARGTVDDPLFRPFWTLADGSGEPEPLFETEIETYPHAWTRDGETLVFVEDGVESGRDIGLFSTSGSPQSRLLLSSNASEGEPSLSPDGRWIAYTSDESGRREVYVQPFPNLGAKWKISADGGWSPLWSRDGTELFYRDGESLMAVAVEAGTELTASRPEPLFKDTTPRWLEGGYDVSLDGKRFLMMEQAEAGADKIVVVLNWLEELKRMAPVN